MTLQVCVLGIDGSGKSTITTALPYILAADFNLRAGSAGDKFWIVEADEDHLTPKFHPDGLPVTGHLSKWFKRVAKRVVDNRRLYPYFKLAQMISQDSAAWSLGRKYGADVIVSDGNVLLSGTGRAGNYLRPASEGANIGVRSPDAADLKAVFEHLLDGKPLTDESQAKLPSLSKAKLVRRMAQRLGIRAGWLPDVVIFLDLSPEIALKRIGSRGGKVDRHENEDDLAQARRIYLKTLDAFGQYRTPEAANHIVVDNMSPGETLRAVVDALRPHLLSRKTDQTPQLAPLGTTSEKLSGSSRWRKLISYRYLVRYLMRNWFRGAWREPTFVFSSLGRLFLKEGYSAGVMRAIYDQDSKRYGLLDRVFLEHSLHRAVYDRLQILTKEIQLELEKRLQGGQDLNIFTAPSGFAYDVFRPLEAICARVPDTVRRIRLVASDLDPQGYLERELAAKANNLGIRFEFLRGDITEDEMREKFQATAPYDMVVFVGLSAWLPKPQTIRHLKWVRDNLREDGVLVSDCFTPEAYALSGRYIGYKANYYTPDIYRTLMDHCGFNGAGALVESGHYEINHVVVVSPRKAPVATKPLQNGEAVPQPWS